MLATEIIDRFDARACLSREVGKACGVELAMAVELIAGRLRDGNKLLLCGNGGSMALCQHLAAEFTVRLKRNRKSIPAMALSADPVSLSAHANDLGYDTVFSRQIEAFGQFDDVLLLFTTSGRSRNLAMALDSGTHPRPDAIAFTGEDGLMVLGAQRCRLQVKVPSKDTQLIQEAHLALGHLLVQGVEDALYGPLKS